MKTKSIIATTLLCASLTAHAATLTGLWEFNDSGNLGKASVGTNLTFQGTMPGTYVTTLADANGSSLSGVITTPTAAGAADRIVATHGIAANGGGSRVNQYSIVMDLFSPVTSRSAWRTIYQTNVNNSDDGDYFISTSDRLGLGGIGYSTNTIDETKWTRLAITVDLSTGGTGFKTYLDGDLFYTHGVPARDGSLALQPTVLFLSDDSGENYPLHIGSIAIYNGALTSAEVLALGKAGAAIPEPSSLALLGLGVFSLLGRRQRK
jgi:hypothetical protein